MCSRKMLPYVIFIGCVVLNNSLTMAGEVVFQKQLPDGKLVVLRKEIPYEPPNQKEIEEAEKELPGGESLKPDHVYEYSLSLFSNDGKQSEKLWAKKFLEYGSKGIPTKLEVYDVSFESETLLVVYKDTGEIIAEFTTPNQKKTKKPVIETGAILSRDGPFDYTIVRSAKIEGSFKDHSIAVDLKFANGKTSKWAFKKDQWIELKEPKPELHVNAKDDHGLTPLMNAAQQDSLTDVEALLKKGANVNATDNEGWTALMYAAENGNVEVVKILVAHGADVNARGKDGAYALKWAAKGKHNAVVELLKKAGAKEQSL